MSEEFFTIKPGLVVAVISLIMLIGLVVVRVSVNFQAKRQKKARNEHLEQARSASKISSNVELDLVWSEAIKSMESLQNQLRGDLSDLEGSLKDEREIVLSKTENLKKLALDSRIPLTLYELYEGMRYYNTKSDEARESDREWHAKVGITDIDVIENNFRTIPGREIHFKLDFEPYLLLGSYHSYSRTQFIELTLYDLDDNTLVTTRVQPDQTGRQLLDQAVISMRQGPWLERFLSCRAKMDVRYREVGLLAEHRDVLELKEKFAIQTDNKSKSNL